MSACLNLFEVSPIFTNALSCPAVDNTDDVVSLLASCWGHRYRAARLLGSAAGPPEPHHRRRLWRVGVAKCQENCGDISDLDARWFMTWFWDILRYRLRQIGRLMQHLHWKAWKREVWDALDQGMMINESMPGETGVPLHQRLAWNL